MTLLTAVAMWGCTGPRLGSARTLRRLLLSLPSIPLPPLSHPHPLFFSLPLLPSRSLHDSRRPTRVHPPRSSVPFPISSLSSLAPPTTPTPSNKALSTAISPPSFAPSPPSPRFSLAFFDADVIPFPTTASVTAPTISSLTFLGTGSSAPSSRRGASSLALTLSNGSSLLVDCGEGTQIQLSRTRVRPKRIEAVLITHLHGDHFFGLFGLLSSLAASGRKEAVVVVGPVGLREMVEETLGRAGGLMELPLHFMTLEEGREYDLGLIAGLHVRAAPLRHTLPSFSYVLTEQTRPGHVLMDKATALGVIGTQAKDLKEGKSVITRMGMVHPHDCLGPPPPPFSVAVVQDSSDSRDSYPILQDVDVLIHECTYEAGLEEMAAERGHSTAAQVGTIAREVNAKALILTHFSARYYLGERNWRELRQQKAEINTKGTGTKVVEKREEVEGDSDGVEGSALMVTADVLVEQAMAAYSQAGTGVTHADAGSGGDSASIPVWAAEDFLVFEPENLTEGRKDLRVKEFAWMSPVGRAKATMAAAERTLPRKDERHQGHSPQKAKSRSPSWNPIKNYSGGQSTDTHTSNAPVQRRRRDAAGNGSIALHSR